MLDTLIIHNIDATEVINSLMYKKHNELYVFSFLFVEMIPVANWHYTAF